MPELTFELLDGQQAAAHAGELQALHAEVYADPPYGQAGDAAAFAERFRVQRRQPGFVLAEARSGGYLIGYAAGMPLRPSTSWWRELTTRLPEDITAERPGRTFALIDLLVRASWRRQGIGHELHDLVLAPARGTGHADRAARGRPAQQAFRELGLAQGGPDARRAPRSGRSRRPADPAAGHPRVTGRRPS